MRLYQHPRERARLYLQGGSKKIYMEFYDENNIRCQFSTRTEDLETAKSILEEQLVVVKWTKSGRLVTTRKKGNLVAEVCDIVSKELESKKGEKNKIETIRHLNKIKEKVGQIEISKLKTSDLNVIYNEVLSATMNANYKKAFNLLFEYAQTEKMIKEPVKLPKSYIKPNTPRVVYSESTLNQICFTIDELTSKSKNIKTRYYGEMLNIFIMFLDKTGLRYGEALDLKVYNVKQEFDLDLDFIIKITKSKTAKRTVTITEKIMRFIQYALNVKRRYNVRCLPTDYIFSNFDNDKIDFTNFLKELRTRYSEEFKEINADEFTLYSLRHSFIRRKIKEKMAAIDIASHCGTSIEMIEKYYNKNQPVKAGHIFGDNE